MRTLREKGTKREEDRYDSCTEKKRNFLSYLEIKALYSFSLENHRFSYTYKDMSLISWEQQLQPSTPTTHPHRPHNSHPQLWSYPQAFAINSHTPTLLYVCVSRKGRVMQLIRKIIKLRGNQSNKYKLWISIFSCLIRLAFQVQFHSFDRGLNVAFPLCH